MQDYTTLVNKDNLLDANFIPSNLIICDNNENNFHNYLNPNLKTMIDILVFLHFLRMQKDMLNYRLRKVIVGSGYRSYNYQKELFDQFVKELGYEKACKKVALPGSSEHQSGLAIDIKYLDDNRQLHGTTNNDEEIKWLKNNAYKYGFILRYPKDKKHITGYNYERWHYRFVGIELSTILHQENITLEEYYQRIKTKDVKIRKRTI